jgi:hypothetical protein
VVVCSPPADQRGNATAPDTASSSVQASQSTASVASGTMSGSASGSASASSSIAVSTGAASAVGGVHDSSSKAGLVIFGLVALGSAAGIFL